MNQRMSIFTTTLIQVLMPFTKNLYLYREDVPASSLFFMSSLYGPCQPEDSILMVFLFLRFDKSVNKECIFHFRIDTSCDWSKKWFPALLLWYCPSP